MLDWVILPFPSFLWLREQYTTALLFNKLKASDPHRHINTQHHGYYLLSFEKALSQKALEKYE